MIAEEKSTGIMHAVDQRANETVQRLPRFLMMLVCNKIPAHSIALCALLVCDCSLLAGSFGPTAAFPFSSRKLLFPARFISNQAAMMTPVVYKTTVDYSAVNEYMRAHYNQTNYFENDVEACEFYDGRYCNHVCVMRGKCLKITGLQSSSHL